MPLDQCVRPTPGGYEIHCSSTLVTGTLGATILWGDDKRRVGISNAHILPDLRGMVFQPNPLGHPDFHKLGVVAGVSAAPLYSTPQEYFHDFKDRTDALYDFAFFNPYEGETTTLIAGGIYPGPPEPVQGSEPPPLEIRNPTVGESVRWIGKTTGAARTGKIVDLDSWGMRSLGNKVYGMGNMIRIEPAGDLSRPGDSGSALVALSDHKIVGLLSGATSDERYEFGSRIPPDEFEITATAYVSDELALERYAKAAKVSPVIR